MKIESLLFNLMLWVTTIVYSQKFEGLAKTPPSGWNSNDQQIPGHDVFMFRLIKI